MAYSDSSGKITYKSTRIVAVTQSVSISVIIIIIIMIILIT